MKLHLVTCIALRISERAYLLLTRNANSESVYISYFAFHLTLLTQAAHF